MRDSTRESEQHGRVDATDVRKAMEEVAHWECRGRLLSGKAENVSTKDMGIKAESNEGYTDCSRARNLRDGATIT